MTYAIYAVVAVPVVILLYKGALATLDQGFRWLAERNGY
jgi:hypothetical protein